MEIILASNSPRRREILSQLGIQYEVIPSKFEEKALDMTPENMVMYFAEGKAMSVARKVNKEAFIIGADTIVYQNGIMGKPKDNVDAARMLRNLSGVFHAVITGISVVHTPSFNQVTDYERTMVKFKNISDEEIQAYIKSGEPMDKAGAYAIQGIGSLLVEKIDGCYFNVVGLPVYRLSKILESFGYKILGR